MSNEAPTMSDLIMSASTAQLDMDELEAYTAGVRKQFAEEIRQSLSPQIAEAYTMFDRAMEKGQNSIAARQEGRMAAYLAVSDLLADLVEPNDVRPT